MSLPSLNVPKVAEVKQVIIAQKQLNAGTIFSALHRGNSIVALDDSFSLKFTVLGNKRVNIDLIRHSVNSKSFTNVQFKPKTTGSRPTKPKEKKKSKIILKKREGVKSI